MAKDQGLFPQQSGGGVQGLFDQGKQHPAPKKPKLPKRRARWRLGLTVVHLTVAAIALFGIARSNRHAHVDVHVPSFSTTPLLSSSKPSETPAFKTMKITPSGGAIANGTYEATSATITGASTRTFLEFAVVGRGRNQHVVYLAGIHVRDASCDHEPRTDPNAGLLLYDDELTGSVHGRTITASTADHETLRATTQSARTMTGTFHFHAYTDCPSGGHFTFKANREPSDKPILAQTIWGALG